MKSLAIRLGTADDAAAIADISHQTFYDTFQNENTKEDMDKFLNQQFTKEALMAEVRAGKTIFLLAFENNDLVGYASLKEGSEPATLGTANALEIGRIYAVAAMIGRGVGASLMQSCIDVARQRGKEVIWLGVWEKNSRAIEFYTKWGFRKFDEHDFVLGNDVQRDWLMKKVVTEPATLNS